MSAAQKGMVSRPGLSGTSQERSVVGVRPAGTRSVSVHTGTKHDRPTIIAIAIGTPKSPKARRACAHTRSPYAYDTLTIISTEWCKITISEYDKNMELC